MYVYLIGQLKQKAKMEISFSCVIIQDSDSKAYYGMVKEVEGVVVKGSTEDEVREKIPKAIKAIIDAKRKYSNANKSILNTNKMVVREYEQNYIAC